MSSSGVLASTEPKPDHSGRGTARGDSQPRAQQVLPRNVRRVASYCPGRLQPDALPAGQFRCSRDSCVSAATRLRLDRLVCWVLLQTTLVTDHRTDIHRRLGWIGAGLGVAAFVLSLAVTVMFVASQVRLESERAAGRRTDLLGKSGRPAVVRDLSVGGCCASPSARRAQEADAARSNHAGATGHGTDTTVVVSRYRWRPVRVGVAGATRRGDRTA